MHQAHLKLHKESILRASVTAKPTSKHGQLAPEEPPITATTFADNEFVLLEYADGPFGKKPPDKLAMQLAGPFQVVGHTGNEYTIRNLVTLRTQNVFVSRLRPFVYDPNRIVPRIIALKDMNRMFDVRAIVRHKGDLKRKKTLQFLVQWEDQTIEDSWESWATLRDTQALHAYLRHIGKPQFILKKFQMDA